MTTGDDQRVRAWMAEKVAIVEATQCGALRVTQTERDGCGESDVLVEDRPLMTLVSVHADNDGELPAAKALADHIATFDPPTLRKLLAVVEAAQARLRKGCNDTCGHALNDAYACDCGQGALLDALTALTEPTHDD